LIVRVSIDQYESSSVGHGPGNSAKFSSWTIFAGTVSILTQDVKKLSSSTPDATRNSSNSNVRPEPSESASFTIQRIAQRANILGHAALVTIASTTAVLAKRRVNVRVSVSIRTIFTLDTGI
jgi:hypothetical protein